MVLNKKLVLGISLLAINAGIVCAMEEGKRITKLFFYAMKPYCGLSWKQDNKSKLISIYKNNIDFWHEKFQLELNEKIQQKNMSFGSKKKDYEIVRNLHIKIKDMQECAVRRALEEEKENTKKAEDALKEYRESVEPENKKMDAKQTEVNKRDQERARKRNALEFSKLKFKVVGFSGSFILGGALCLGLFNFMGWFKN